MSSNILFSILLFPLNIYSALWYLKYVPPQIAICCTYFRIFSFLLYFLLPSLLSFDRHKEHEISPSAPNPQSNLPIICSIDRTEPLSLLEMTSREIRHRYFRKAGEAWRMQHDHVDRELCSHVVCECVFNQVLMHAFALIKSEAIRKLTPPRASLR